MVIIKISLCRAFGIQNTLYAWILKWRRDSKGLLLDSRLDSSDIGQSPKSSHPTGNGDSASLTSCLMASASTSSGSAYKYTSKQHMFVNILLSVVSTGAWLYKLVAYWPQWRTRIHIIMDLYYYGLLCKRFQVALGGRL